MITKGGNHCFLFKAGLLFLALVLALMTHVFSAQGAEAWGSRNYTAPWGCQAHFQSFVATHRNAQTIKMSDKSCSEMHARLRTSSGGGTTWHVHPTFAKKQSTNSLHVGGQHKVCGGCATFST